MIFGGWNYSSFKTVQKLKNHDDADKVEKVEIEGQELPKSDFFIVNGVEIRNEDQTVIIKGH